jgi:dihydrofolate reductase
MSLDGFIATPSGGYDWIPRDPDIDFKQIYARYDTLLIGRRTFEVMKGAGGGKSTPGMQVYVFSRTLRQKDHPDVTISSDPQAVIADLHAKPGKDIWLFGGGVLFGSVLQAGLVDAVEVAVVPVLLGAGIPLQPPAAKQVKLKLLGQRIYSKTGIVSLEYAIQQ